VNGKNKENKIGRPVDAAMSEERPEKQAVRKLWMAKAKEYDETISAKDELLYLTLCGEEPRELELLAQQGIIKMTETGAISDEHSHRVAVIESNPLAIAKLMSQIPGIKIYPEPLKDLLRGDNMIRFPDGDHEAAFKARIINLDLNGILLAIDNNGELYFPIMKSIKKIGMIHAGSPIKKWALFLTLHGEINWNNQACKVIQDFLSSNFKAVLSFGESSKTILGEDLYEKILENELVEFSKLSREKQQLVLNISVPKMIANELIDQGWRIETSQNLRYGRKEAASAPMVTWIFEFKKDTRSSVNSAARYHDNLISITTNAGQIDGEGEIISYAE
jgi:hypothetical protein